MMRTLFLQAPSFDGFDGGAGSRFQCRREIRSFWYPTWLAQPAALVEGSKLVDAPPHGLKLSDVVATARDFDLVVLHTSSPSFASDIRTIEALKSANPADPPAMFPNYLATETDRRAIVEGLKIGRRILATSHMRYFVTEEYQPGPSVASDEQLMEHARNSGSTVFHPTSTCKMGIDPMAVVDPELRVHGMQGLRVVDASIMPTVVSGNTNAATIMIGEKAADMVRQPMRMAA